MKHDYRIARLEGVGYGARWVEMGVVSSDEVDAKAANYRKQGFEVRYYGNCMNLYPKTKKLPICI